MIFSIKPANCEIVLVNINPDFVYLVGVGEFIFNFESFDVPQVTFRRNVLWMKKNIDLTNVQDVEKGKLIEYHYWQALTANFPHITRQ